MAKYSQTIRDVRKFAAEDIPKFLKKSSLTLAPIYDAMKEKYSDNCDKTILCSCGNLTTIRPEWKHQVRWALQDLKYSGVIKYDSKTRKYTLIR